jgi:hypothetical protein
MFSFLSSGAARAERMGMIQTSCTARPSSTQHAWTSHLRRCADTSMAL